MTFEKFTVDTLSTSLTEPESDINRPLVNENKKIHVAKTPLSK
jgi:hypothetical protein